MQKVGNSERMCRIKQSRSYKALKAIARLMDTFMLDAVAGFFLPAFGDVVTALAALPFVYVSAFRVRSLPLTLAVVYNTLRDVAIGVLPFVGDIADVFHRSYIANLKLIVGFVEGDENMVGKVNRKAVRMGVLSVVLLCIIALLVWLVAKFSAWLVGLF